MIKDEEFKVKVAEHPDEVLWTTLKQESEALIKQSKNHTRIQEAMLETANRKLEEKAWLKK